MTLCPLPPKALIGMIHLGALPGTPAHEGDFVDLRERALRDMGRYLEAGFDALLVENMHDLPYLKRSVGPEITAAMAVLTELIVRESGLPVGVQVLAGANREAIAVAQAAGADFIRAEGFVFAHVADEGVMESDAGELLRYRRAIGAGHIAIFADLKKKHSSHAITADVDLADTIHAAEFFGVDGVIVTGTATGRAAAPADVASAKGATHLPVLVGSGITPENLAAIAAADGFIVGTWVKEDGDWRAPVDGRRATELAAVARRLFKG